MWNSHRLKKIYFLNRDRIEDGRRGGDDGSELLTYQPSTKQMKPLSPQNIYSFTLSFVHICPRVRDNSDELKRASRHCRHRSQPQYTIGTSFRLWTVSSETMWVDLTERSSHHTRRTIHKRRDAMHGSTNLSGAIREYNRINGGCVAFSGCLLRYILPRACWKKPVTWKDPFSIRT